MHLNTKCGAGHMTEMGTACSLSFTLSITVKGETVQLCTWHAMQFCNACLYRFAVCFCTHQSRLNHKTYSNKMPRRGCPRGPQVDPPVLSVFCLTAHKMFMLLNLPIRIGKFSKCFKV